MKRRRQLRYASRGASAMELAMGSFIIIVLAMLSLDIGFLTIAHGLNNQACRDATRAASMMDNPDDALNAAMFALKTHINVDGAFFKDASVTKLVYNGVSPHGTADSMDPQNQPTVFCTTQLRIKLPVAIDFFGTKLIADNGTYLCSSSFLFPILNLHVHLPQGEFDPHHGTSFFPQLPTISVPCYDAPPACPPPVPPVVKKPPLSLIPQTGQTPG